MKSGDDPEHRAAIRLLGGRPYFIKLEFSKANQGVDRQEESRVPQTAGEGLHLARLETPEPPVEIIPTRSLSTTSSPELFVVQTRFPPDDRSVGYERGTSISKAWDQATTDGAIEVAGYVTAHLEKLAGANSESADSLEKLRKFCVEFAERAFRRPLYRGPSGDVHQSPVRKKSAIGLPL